ncbi:hypothetical protein B0H14DRAFT_3494064 [Mycena olivaceomarginata]|nr:hypothetical protein B0H14DRAFT_3494064 [Mycena olivaceomarginata]
MEVLGYSWDGSVYAGLHQFHQRKRFDPGSQDLARHLGYPLFEVSSEYNVDIFQPSRTWNIIMVIQFVLIMVLGAFSFYDYLLARDQHDVAPRQHELCDPFEVWPTCEDQELYDEFDWKHRQKSVGPVLHYHHLQSYLQAVLYASLCAISP